MSLSILSCTKETPQEDLLPGNLFILETPEEGAVCTKEMTMESEWRFINREKWYMVSPVSGAQGSSQVTVTALEPNRDLRERIGRFDLNVEGRVTTECVVIQRGKPGLDVPDGEVVFAGTAGSVSFSIERNVDFTVESLPEWLSFVESTDSEGELLADGVRSVCIDTRLDFSIQANDDGNNRTGEVRIATADSVYVVNVRQRMQADIDFDAEFYRRSLGVRFTASWCGYCPMMGQAYEDAMAQSPDRIVPINMHPLTSEGGLGWNGTSEYEQYYKTNGAYPVGVINNIAQVRNQKEISKTAGIVSGLNNEAIESYPAKTMISVTSSIDNEKKVTMRVKLAMKEALEYRLSAFLLEDGVVYPQINGGNEYVHNYVVRARFTEMSGLIVPEVEDDSISEFELSGYVTPNVKDISNAYLVVYVTYPGNPTEKGVDDAVYYNYGTIVDNVVRLGLDDSVGFRYDE